MRSDVDGDGADVGDDVDDDLDDARDDDDDDDDGDDLPFREVISPAESARPRWLFSSVCFRFVAVEESRKKSRFWGFTPGGVYRGEGGPRGAPGIQEGAWGGPA